MKTYQNDEAIDIFGYNCLILGVCLKVPDFSILLLRHLIIFFFAHASMIIKDINKVIHSLNRIYLNEFFIPLFINLVSDSSINTYYLVELATLVVLLKL